MSQITALVNKLGHRLEEIRLRALQTLVDKLNYGLITEEQLTDQANFFENLIKWLHQEGAPAKEDVLKLIFRILKQQPDTSVLLQKADPGLACLRKLTDSDVLVTDIVNLALRQMNSARYSVGEARPPDSTRTLTSVTTRHSGPGVSSKTSTGLPSARSEERHYGEFRPPQSEIYRAELPTPKRSSLEKSVEQKSSTRSDSWAKASQVTWSLPSVPLVSSDQSILSSIKDSLINSSAIKTCHFFSSVMLHDFPSEIFLQYPGIIKVLLSVAQKSGLARDAAIHCLHVFVQTLHSRLLFTSHLEFTSLNTFGTDEGEGSTEGDQSDSSSQHYQQEGYVTGDRERQQTSERGEDALNIPQFCLMVLSLAVGVVGDTALAAPLTAQTLRLWSVVVPDGRCVWTDQADRRLTLLQDIARGLLNTVTKKIKQSVSYEPVSELHVMSASLRIVECLVPAELAADVLPTELQDIISFSLVDPVLVINYPALHKTALNYANVFKRPDLSVYSEVLRVHTALEAAVRFTREVAALAPPTALTLLTHALPALPLLPDLTAISQFTQYVVERRDMSEDEISQAAQLTRSLLAHADKAVVSEAYRVFHKLVTTLLGPRQALSELDPLPRLRFLVHTPVLLEMTCFGLTNPDNEVRQNAEQILVHIVKCERLVGEGAWRRVLEQLSPVLPLLQCHAGHTTTLGRTLIHLLDPDIAATAALSTLQVLIGNLRLLFHKDPQCRQEGASRLVWLTGLQQLRDQRLADVCLIDVALTSHAPATGMYEAGSVVRVLELLAGPCVEARVRQSAMTQISVMTEDTRLHQVFIDHQGVELFISTLCDVVDEMNEDAAGYITPVVATLKHLSRHNTSVRQSLSQHEQFLVCLTKSLFQVREWRLQRDATQLLALLVYADITLSTPAGLSLPHLVTQTACLPFACHSHWTVSPHTVTSLKGVVSGNKVVERLVAAQWAVLTEGLEGVLQLTAPPPNPPLLTLSGRVLRQIQHSHVSHNCRLLLHNFQNATTHHAALQALTSLTRYLELGWLVDTDALSKLPWKATFRRFLLSPPSSAEDFALLLLVLKFIHYLIIEVKDQEYWVSEALLAPPHCLLKIILPATSARHDHYDMWKKVCLWLLSVCRQCLRVSPSPLDWQPLVRLLYQCLHYSQTQPSYTLELLGSELGCLVSAVTGPGPATDKDSAALWQLLSSFNCDPAANIFMGLGVTRLTIICLNRLLSLAKHKEVWLGEENLVWVPGLWSSRDVLVRASALQLLAGLAFSPRGAATVLSLTTDVFNSVLRIMVDHKEASIVREHATLLLTNILAHSSNKEFASSVQKVNYYQEFRETISLVALTDVSTHIEVTTGKLHTTPRLVRAGCWFLYNLAAQSSDAVNQSLVSSGLATSLCRLLSESDKACSACAAGGSAADMMAAACRLLALCCGCCEPALLQEVLPTLAALLDLATYNTSQSGDELSEEVRGLWHECLRLLAAVLSSCPSPFILPSAAVNTLTRCLSDADHPSLVLTALHTVPALVDHIIPRDEVAVCAGLLELWPGAGRLRPAVLAGLSSLLGKSAAATQTALVSGLTTSLVTALRQLHLTLTVQTTSTDKLNKNNPLMVQLCQLLTLVNNLLYGSDAARRSATELGVADVVHKLWAWCLADTQLIHLTLDLLLTFTANCPPAAQSLVLTSTVTGACQRKSPSPHSLLHTLLALLTREQHRPAVRARALRLLSHSCQAHHCRAVIAKSALLSKWAELWSDRRPLSEQTELSWLRFILVFSSFPEGQNSIPKSSELFSQLLQCVESGRVSCRSVALAVLRNLTACPVNRTRFLGTKPLLTLVRERLLSGSAEERRDAALIVWSLSANQQKAKVTLRGLGLLSALQLAAATSPDDVYATVTTILQPS